MSASARITVIFSFALVYGFIAPASGQQADRREPSLVAPASASSTSMAALEAEISDLRNRLDSIEWAKDAPYAQAADDCFVPGWLVSVDYLNWDLRQRGTDFAITTDAIAIVGRGEVHNLDMDRNSGVRTNVGYRTRSGLEWGIGYTYFQTDGAASAVAPADGNMWATRSHPAENEEALTADASANFGYNVFDLEARYPLVHGCPVTMQVFGGLRWADIDQTFQVAYNGDDFDDGLYRNATSMTGFGLRLGAESQWHLNSSWSMFGSAAGSILYGRFQTHLLETNFAGVDTIVDVRDDYGQAVPVIEGAMGVAWNRGPVQIRGGYEMANWFNLADRSMFPDEWHEGVYAPQSTDVLLDGLFVRFSYTH